jgi:hypothetical protein
MSNYVMPFAEDSWKDRNYEELMDEAIRLEMLHKGMPEPEGQTVRTQFEALVRTCSHLPKPDYADFAPFYRSMCANDNLHPLALDAFLRAAWKACHDDANGLRLIPGKAELEQRARDLRRALAFDTEQSWDYEGLPVQFRSDLEEGEDPATVAASYGWRSSMSIAEMEEGMREYIESDELEAHSARVRAAYEAEQARRAKA